VVQIVAQLDAGEDVHEGRVVDKEHQEEVGNLVVECNRSDDMGDRRESFLDEEDNLVVVEASCADKA
jgi:hypothetical protein